MTTTSGRFDLTRWDEDTYADDDTARLVQVELAKTFEGGITGTSTARVLQALTPRGGASYVGVERVEAAVDGRKGTFVLRHSASGTVDGGDFRVDVVPGSGTGELAGLSGELTIVNDGGEHSYTFTYDLA